ncbi:MAG: hypothetical protein Q8R98_03610, partial [Rubrivivax sp.]|nr:hypothetical protein [Rubrivivax sp.]
MTISLVATLLRADSHSPLISATGTTTGATLMWQAHTVDSGALVDDINATSPVNTYTALTQAQENTGPVVVRSGYNAAPTVGALHSVVAPIFFAGLGGLAFSGTHAAPLDGSPTVATVASSGTSLATGSKTPSVGGCLVISKIAWFGSPGTVTPPAGYTLALDLSAYSNLNKMAVAIKFKSAGDTSSENPTWGWTSATQAAGGTQVFKPEPVAPVLTGDITTAEA